MKRREVPRRKTMLVILDGYGVNPSKKYNAIYEANTPRLDEYFGSHPHTTLQASGKSVGLPKGQMGNSEVGHFTIGSGMIVKQDLVRIDDAIEDGRFFEKPALLSSLEIVKAYKSKLHLVGLVSDGGVHSHINHLKALLKMCSDHNIEPVVHVITDGRDTSPKSAKGYIEQVLETMKETGGHIATVTGRFYAMDRDNRWERTKLAWDAMVNSEGIAAKDPLSAIDDAYANGETDEFVQPRIMPNAERIKEDDSVIFFNFRNDRPRQLVEALGAEEFEHFDRGDFETTALTCLTEYDKSLLAPVVFRPERPSTNLSHVVALAGHKQFHCAETEKYAHVTFFFNGGREKPYAGEDRVMVPSPHVDTYDECPEMSAEGVADAVIEAVEKDEYGFIVVNFANGDMVGHTGVISAIKKAVVAVDDALGMIVNEGLENGYSIIVFADHGNVEDQSPAWRTSHTLNPVPCILIDKNLKSAKPKKGCGLEDIAPTALKLLGLKKPKEMTGNSIFDW